MKPTRWTRVEEVFRAAVELPASQREAFLAGLESGEPDIVAEVLELLAADAREDGILERQAIPQLPNPTAKTLSPGQPIGRYIVLEPLGTGGMATVYSAYDPELDRRIALKLMHRRFEPDSHAARIRREAQALARLDHPNVVGIYDVGFADGQLFLALQLVDGVSLRDWSQQGQRSWREVLAVFQEAGLGIAAAHRAGLVHRDIKPENILIARDGRVLVADFGLARLADSSDSTLVDAAGARLVDKTLTQANALIGTPAYLAPELLEGSQASAQSDLYSFCVTLWEALYGARPTAPPTSPDGTDVPGWMRRIVERGLAPDAADRFPSMAALLGALGRDPARRRRRQRLAGLAFAALLTLAISLVALRSARSDRCNDGRERLEAFWNPQRRGQIQGAFVATGASYAVDIWNRIVEQLDNYGLAWETGYREACRATHVRRDPSMPVFDRRMACLDARLHSMENMVRLLAEADVATVRQAVSALQALPSIETCADEAQLNEIAPPATEATQLGVEILEKGLEQSLVLENLRRLGEALEIAQDVRNRAQKLDYPPFLAKARVRVGLLLEQMQRFEAAREELQEALWLAQSIGYDRLEAQAWIALTHNRGIGAGQLQEARRMGRHAAAVLERMGGDEGLQAELLGALAATEAEVGGDWGRAQDLFREAVALLESVYDGDHSLLAIFLFNLATALSVDDLRQAKASYQRALDMRQALFGTEHPDYGMALLGLAYTQLSLGEVAEAKAALERGRALLVRSLGEDHPSVTEAEFALSMALQESGDLEGAIRFAASATAARKALLGPESPRVAQTLVRLARAKLAAGQLDHALRHCEEAERISKTMPEGDHWSVALAWRCLAEVRLERGEPTEAQILLERVLGSSNRPAQATAEARFLLAKALRARGVERDRRRELAEAALKTFQDTGRSPMAAEVEAWLRLEPPASPL